MSVIAPHATTPSTRSGSERGGTECVRTAGRDADGGEAIDPESIGDEEHVVDRIVERAAGPRIGEPVTGPVDADDAQPGVGCLAMEPHRLEPVARAAVAPQHRRPVRIPELGDTDGSSRSGVEP